MADMTLKKRPMDRAGYKEQFSRTEGKRILAAADPRRLTYHFQPVMGWINDPNGLCQKDGVYHIYHQYVPFYPELCSVLWGHATTTDFIHYEIQEPVIYPDTDWDQNGAYSGSAFLKDGTMYVYYTGNVRHTDRDYDYVTKGREQNTILTTSEDGFHFSDKRLLMTHEDYPSDLSLHVRDPQVFCEHGRYYMIQGARDLEGRGSVLLFESEDLISWTYRLRFCTKEPFGYMWECPNYLKIGGQKFLIACPQEYRQEGARTVKENRCGYFPLQYDFEGGTDHELGAYHALDHGFDFYAPQVFRDESGRWILLGWMSTPDADYDCEVTAKSGWVHALTIPRELYVNAAGRLCQRPLRELEAMRREIRSGMFTPGTGFHEAVPPCFELILSMEDTEVKSQEFRLCLRKSAVLSYGDGVLCLDLTGCGAGRRIRTMTLEAVRDVRILSDTSSLEIFVNGGEAVFTSRVYDSMEGLQVHLTSGHTGGMAKLYELICDD